MIYVEPSRYSKKFFLLDSTVLLNFIKWVLGSRLKNLFKLDALIFTNQGVGQYIVNSLAIS